MQQTYFVSFPKPDPKKDVTRVCLIEPESDQVVLSMYPFFTDPKSIDPERVEIVRVSRRDLYGPDVEQVEIIVPAVTSKQERCLRAYHAAKVRRDSQMFSAQTTVSTEQSEKEAVLSFDMVAPFINAMLMRMCAVAGKGIRLELSGDEPTASTDCRSVVRFNPDPFLRGEIEAGFGRGFHEVGHVLYDRFGTPQDPKRTAEDQAYGALLMQRAHAEGGERRAHLLNLVMDRRSDDLQAKEFSGNADALWHRLGDLMPGEHVDEEGNVVPRRSGRSRECDRTVFIDFAYAIKKRTKPAFRVVKKCVKMAMRAIHRVNEEKRPYAHLLTVVMQIEQALCDAEPGRHAKPKQPDRSADQMFSQAMHALKRREDGDKSSKRFKKLFQEFLQAKLKARRQKMLAQLPAALKKMQSHPGFGAGLDPSQEGIVQVGPHARSYQEVLCRVGNRVRALRRVLDVLRHPVAIDLQGLTQGEFDLDALPAFVAGRSDIMKIETVHRKLDLAIAVVRDVSGSMGGIKEAPELAVIFNEALLGSEKEISAHQFAFDDKVFDCGDIQRNSGVASQMGGGGTNEAFALRIAGSWLARQKRRLKILVMICDGAPADVNAVRAQTQQLLKRGIFPMRILVGVHAAPHTYPCEPLFDSWNELNRELVQLFSSIFQASRA